MRIVQNIRTEDWKKLCVRPASPVTDVPDKVRSIVAHVRERGDAAIREYSERFDGVAPAQVRVPVTVRDQCAQEVSPELSQAIETAIASVTKFHTSQLVREASVETIPGVVCFRRSVPIERVGIYIPGGTAELFSTLIMLAVPARVARCSEVVLMTPGGRLGVLNPIVARCAQLLEIEEIYLVGGAQAIAALAYGTETIPAVQKICGPGNAFVTEAKLQVAAQGVAIDLPAGPSEVLVIADESADPRWVAADLLAQAEHGPDSQVVVVGLSHEIVSRIIDEVVRQVESLPRRDIAQQALASSFALVVSSVEEAIMFSNTYAPEHLILAVQGASQYTDLIRNAGSVFLGAFAAEALGDYASGTNHVLPTNGAARAFSGVSVDTFMKKVTFQDVTQAGLNNLAPAVVAMARAEGLEAHARAVTIRQEVLSD